MGTELTECHVECVIVRFYNSTHLKKKKKKKWHMTCVTTTTWQKNSNNSNVEDIINKQGWIMNTEDSNTQLWDPRVFFQTALSPTNHRLLSRTTLQR